MYLNQSSRSRQSGALLIEALVAMLVLSFGMLAVGSMLSYAVQLPKMSGYRAQAVNLAAGHVERIKANPDGFKANAYEMALSYDGSIGGGCIPNCSESDLSNLEARCIYPNCSNLTLAKMDNATTNQAVRMALPGGGMLIKCDTSPCSSATGSLWLVWQEPSVRSAVNPATSDICPSEVTGRFTNPRPRCLYVRFAL